MPLTPGRPLPGSGLGLGTPARTHAQMWARRSIVPSLLTHNTHEWGRYELGVVVDSIKNHLPDIPLMLMPMPGSDTRPRGNQTDALLDNETMPFN